MYSSGASKLNEGSLSSHKERNFDSEALKKDTVLRWCFAAVDTVGLATDQKRSRTFSDGGFPGMRPRPNPTKADETMYVLSSAISALVLRLCKYSFSKYDAHDLPLWHHPRLMRATMSFMKVLLWRPLCKLYAQSKSIFFNTNNHHASIMKCIESWHFRDVTVTRDNGAMRCLRRKLRNMWQRSH